MRQRGARSLRDTLLAERQAAGTDRCGAGNYEFYHVGGIDDAGLADERHVVASIERTKDGGKESTSPVWRCRHEDAANHGGQPSAARPQRRDAIEDIRAASGGLHQIGVLLQALPLKAPRECEFRQGREHARFSRREIEQVE